MENIPYTEDDQTHAYSSATHNEVPNDASDQFGPGSNDKFTINPVFDIQAKQRKFNAYLVGEENLSPTQDNTGKSQEYGISEEALNADDEKIISTEKEDALQEDVDGAFVPQLQYNALRTDENDIGEGRQYGIAEDVLNEYADMIIRNEREEHDLQEDVDNDLEWHIIQENARCSDENGLDNNDNTENNTEQHDVTENQEDIVIPNLYREESFKKTCFPQLWARSFEIIFTDTVDIISVQFTVKVHLIMVMGLYA